MGKVLLLLMFSLLLFTREATAQTSYFKPQFGVALEPKAGKATLKQCSRCAPRKVSKIWMVEDNHIKLIEDNFLKVKNQRSWNYDGIRDLNSYAFQYIGLTIKNKKYIYVNAFLARDQQELDKYFDYWKTQAVVVCDGGSGYWGVLFDVESLEFSELCINGHA